MSARPEKPDWRIGILAKSKFKEDGSFYSFAERNDQPPSRIIDVLPSGSGGITDTGGVLMLRLETGQIILARSQDWVTA